MVATVEACVLGNCTMQDGLGKYRFYLVDLLCVVDPLPTCRSLEGDPPGPLWASCLDTVMHSTDARLTIPLQIYREPRLRAATSRMNRGWRTS